jgi:hypothetical protein
VFVVVCVCMRVYACVYMCVTGEFLINPNSNPNRCYEFLKPPYHFSEIRFRLGWGVGGGEEIRSERGKGG